MLSDEFLAEFGRGLTVIGFEVDAKHDWGALKPSYISQSQRDSSKVFGNAESSKANVRVSQPGRNGTR